MLVKVFSKAHFLWFVSSSSGFFQSPLFGKMIDFITGTLIPKLQFFYDEFFRTNGGFIEDLKDFLDDSGIGSIVLGLGTVTTIIIGMKVASKFSTLASGFSRIGGFLGNLGSRLKGMKLPKAFGGLFLAMELTWWWFIKSWTTRQSYRLQKV